MTVRVDISIGPVQGFVAQSRRTRDLWGSSYLLAFLSAHAMRGASGAGGEIIQPLVDEDPLYLWAGGEGRGEPPFIGSVPNHFAVETDADPAAVANAACDSFRQAWNKVCAAVWERFIAHAAHLGDGTRAIWDRQVSTFWDISWTAGPPDEHGSLLARRKLWRSHHPPDEPGDKCAVIDDLQELSGCVRARDRERQDRFWKSVIRRIGPLDLDEDKERLSAIALVKRLFPKVSQDALGWEVGSTHWPSTLYVAAVPWIRRVVSRDRASAREYAEMVKIAASVPFSTPRPPLQDLAPESAGDFPKLDANYFHEDFVLDPKQCPLKEDDEDARNELAKALNEICEHDGIGRPARFYALLLADGDRLGKLVGEVGGEDVSRALAKFTEAAPNVVEKHDGVTIYAGGDDVMAMLPVDGALACAEDLSNTYRASFDGTSTENATLSAALAFAQIKMPLGYVLRQAHRLLDDVAKDGNGRNSLAAAVLKPAGINCQWTTSWTRQDQSGGASAVALIEKLKSSLTVGGSEIGLSSSLVYRIRGTLSTLCGWDSWHPGEWGYVPQGIDLSPFLQAEIHRSIESISGAEQARRRSPELTAQVSALLRQARNPQSDAAPARVGVDALLLARFLADPSEGEDSR